MAVQEKSKEKRQRHWTPRDLPILTLVMQQRAIRLDQVPQFIALFEATSGSTHEAQVKSNAHNLVERLQREGFFHLHRFGKGQPAWIWLTQKGLHVLDSSLSWKCPARSAVPLLYIVNAVRLLLTEQNPQGTWVSQQQLRSTDKNFYQLPTVEFLTDTGERMAIHVVCRLTGTDEQITTRMRQQLERETSSGTRIILHSGIMLPMMQQSGFELRAPGLPKARRKSWHETSVSSPIRCKNSFSIEAITPLFEHLPGQQMEGVLPQSVRNYRSGM